MSNPRLTLIVIDMLRDYFDRLPALAAQREKLTDAINELVRAFRAADQPVIWVRQEFRADLSDGFLEMRRLGVAVTIAGTDGCLMLPELDVADRDRVIVKKRYSAFFRTGLDETLADLAPTSLVVAGINTHACVRTTVIDAYQRDYDVILPSDCVASHDPEHHAVTLRYLDGKMARALPNAEILRMLPAGRAGAHE